MREKWETRDVELVLYRDFIAKLRKDRFQSPPSRLKPDGRRFSNSSYHVLSKQKIRNPADPDERRRSFGLLLEY